MKKFTLCSVIVTFALCVAAVAQTSGAGGAQGTQGSSPSMGQSSSQQPGMGTGTGQTDQNTNRAEKSERKLKGCVQSQGGQYVLETKKGKAVNLTGQDVSAHVGHEVALKGNFESGGSSGMTASSSGNTAGAGEKTFNVTNVEMISESCGGGKNKGTSGTMGGPGTGPSGNTPSSGTGTGTGTTPPK
jgi:hypothetical protein